jgi:hypothetical protein
VEKYGEHWKFMEERLVVRTDAQIRNRYQVFIRQRNKELKKSLERSMKNAHSQFDKVWSDWDNDLDFSDQECAFWEMESIIPVVA